MRNINHRTAVRAAAGVAGFAVLAAAATLGARVVLADDAAPPPVAGSPVAFNAGLGSAPAPEKAGEAKHKKGARPVVVTAPGGQAPVPKPAAGPVTTTATRIPSSIPPRAFLQASDAPGAGSTPERRDSGELPDFCGLNYQQTGRLGIRATQFMYLTEKNPPENSTPAGTAIEDIMVFRGDGADRFMDRLREAVRACPTETRGSVTVTNVLRGGVGAGDESVLIDRNQPAFGGDGEPTGDGSLHHRYFSAVRVGDAVAFVVTSGWENLSADRGDAVHLGRRSGYRLDAWR
ncbi:hypothetical protein [Actinoplanes sp. NPDC049265]|uniref:hypothetical protein n=1 Tax=Actinoplanes sp. NPDC049265 TaxID=3363902 RepID=UPI0037125D69